MILNSILRQIQNNSLAIISLVVAFSALGYNTWRNELTESNRNIRMAGFEMLLHIGELQKTTYLAHYDADVVQGNPRTGWSQVLVLRDLSHLIESQHAVRADALYQAWRENWQALGKDDESVLVIDNALDDLRSDILQTLKDLD